MYYPIGFERKLQCVPVSLFAPASFNTTKSRWTCRPARLSAFNSTTMIRPIPILAIISELVDHSPLHISPDTVFAAFAGRIASPWHVQVIDFTAAHLGDVLQLVLTVIQSQEPSFLSGASKVVTVTSREGTSVYPTHADPSGTQQS